jgi:hypothetical protein
MEKSMRVDFFLRLKVNGYELSICNIMFNSIRATLARIPLLGMPSYELEYTTRPSACLQYQRNNTGLLG